jgi:hypothetical protein
VNARTLTGATANATLADLITSHEYDRYIRASRHRYRAAPRPTPGRAAAVWTHRRRDTSTRYRRRPASAAALAVFHRRTPRRGPGCLRGSRPCSGSPSAGNRTQPTRSAARAWSSDTAHPPKPLPRRGHSAPSSDRDSPKTATSYRTLERPASGPTPHLEHGRFSGLFVQRSGGLCSTFFCISTTRVTTCQPSSVVCRSATVESRVIERRYAHCPSSGR